MEPVHFERAVSAWSYAIAWHFPRGGSVGDARKSAINFGKGAGISKAEIDAVGECFDFEALKGLVQLESSDGS